MRSYFTNLLTSAWATKSEYFVLVGFLFGVAIAYLFSVPDVWAFTIGLAQIVGGLGVAAAVIVAVLQIRAIDRQNKEGVKRQQHHAAIRAYNILATYRNVIDVAGEQLTRTLCKKDVCWRLDGAAIHVKRDPCNYIHTDFKRLALEFFPDLELMEEGIFLSEAENGLEDINKTNFTVMETVRYLQRSVVDLKRLMSADINEGAQLDETFRFSVLFQFRIFLELAPNLAAWLVREHPVQKPGSDADVHSERDWMSLVWPQAEDIIKLAKENPPTDWGGWRERSEKAWRTSGEPGDLPVDTRVYVEVHGGNHN